MASKTKFITAEFPIELARKLEARAKDLDTDVSKLLRKIVRTYFGEDTVGDIAAKDRTSQRDK